jgi:DNA-binding phage protein
MREMSVTEQRYKAILGVIADSRTVSEVASDWGVCRQTMHRSEVEITQHPKDDIGTTGLGTSGLC